MLKTTYYAGLYEKEVTGSSIKENHYIYGGDGLAGILKRQGGTDTMYYVHKDHLGSIEKITNSAKAVVQRSSFDSWGRRRNPNNWTYTGIPSTIFSRGYTGHEHLDQFDLINMNGRMYDPLLGRFLSSDKFVQDASFSQSYNRYSYGLNNPLRYTDPSGWQLAPYYLGRGIEWRPFSNDIMNPPNEQFGANEKWYNSYQKAKRKGYSGDALNFLKEISDPSFNGEIVTSTYVTYEYDVDGNYAVTITAVTHYVTLRIDASGQAAGQWGGDNDPRISVGLSVGDGIIGGLEQSYTYGNNNVKYDQRINGKVRTPSVLTRANQMNATKMASSLKVVGRGVTGLSVAASGYQFFNSDMSGNDYVRLSGSLIITGTAFIPIVGPIISIGLGVADNYGAFNGIYNYFD